MSGTKRSGPGEAELLEACRAARAAHPAFGVKRVFQAVAEAHPGWRLTERRVRRAMRSATAGPTTPTGPTTTNGGSPPPRPHGDGGEDGAGEGEGGGDRAAGDGGDDGAELERRGDPERPFGKARNAYLVFADEKREQMRREVSVSSPALSSTSLRGWSFVGRALGRLSVPGLPWKLCKYFQAMKNISRNHLLCVLPFLFLMALFQIPCVCSLPRRLQCASSLVNYELEWLPEILFGVERG